MRLIGYSLSTITLLLPLLLIRPPLSPRRLLPPRILSFARKIANHQQFLDVLDVMHGLLEVTGYGQVVYGTAGAGVKDAGLYKLGLGAANETGDVICSVIMSELLKAEGTEFKKRFIFVLEAEDLHSNEDRLTEALCCLRLLRKLATAPAFVSESLVEMKPVSYAISKKPRRGAVLLRSGCLLSARELANVLAKALHYVERLLPVEGWYNNDMHVSTVKLCTAVADILTAMFVDGRAVNNQNSVAETPVPRRCAQVLAVITASMRFNQTTRKFNPLLATMEIALLRLVRGLLGGNGAPESRPRIQTLVSLFYKSQTVVSGAEGGEGASKGTSNDVVCVCELPSRLDGILHVRRPMLLVIMV